MAQKCYFQPSRLIRLRSLVRTQNGPYSKKPQLIAPKVTLTLATEYSLPAFVNEDGQHLLKIAHYSIVSYSEDISFRVFIDSNNVLSIATTGQVRAGAGESHTDIEDRGEFLTASMPLK